MTSVIGLAATQALFNAFRHFKCMDIKLSGGLG